MLLVVGLRTRGSGSRSVGGNPAPGGQWESKGIWRNEEGSIYKRNVREIFKNVPVECDPLGQSWQNIFHP